VKKYIECLSCGWSKEVGPIDGDAFDIGFVDMLNAWWELGMDSWEAGLAPAAKMSFQMAEDMGVKEVVSSTDENVDVDARHILACLLRTYANRVESWGLSRFEDDGENDINLDPERCPVCGEKTVLSKSRNKMDDMEAGKVEKESSPLKKITPSLQAFGVDKDLLLDFISTMVVGWLSTDKDPVGAVDGWRENVIAETRENLSRARILGNRYIEAKNSFESRMEIFCKKMKEILEESAKLRKIAEENRKKFG
jgi:hypothetical protein